MRGARAGRAHRGACRAEVLRIAYGPRHGAIHAALARMTRVDPFSRVLVATDLQADSFEAVVQADALARATHAALAVVAVAVHAPTTEAFARFSESAQSSISGRIEALASRLEARVRELTGREPHAYAGFVDPGDVVEAILARARSWRADLLVAGTHDRRGLAELLLGSVADSLLRRAPCSMLLARPSPGRGPVVVACDLEGDTAHLVAVAAALARARGVDLVAVHAIDARPSDAQLVANALFAGQPPTTPTHAELDGLRHVARAAIQTALDAVGANGSIDLAEGRASTALLERTRAHDASLLVTGTAGRRGLARLALGSVAEELARRAPCSVLVVRQTVSY
jgi:nucleotide-binding universal stress UspA family protein